MVSGALFLFWPM